MPVLGSGRAAEVRHEERGGVAVRDLGGIEAGVLHLEGEPSQEVSRRVAAVGGEGRTAPACRRTGSRSPSGRTPGRSGASGLRSPSRPPGGRRWWMERRWRPWRRGEKHRRARHAENPREEAHGDYRHDSGGSARHRVTSGYGQHVRLERMRMSTSVNAGNVGGWARTERGHVNRGLALMGPMKGPSGEKPSRFRRHHTCALRMVAPAERRRAGDFPGTEPIRQRCRKCGQQSGLEDLVLLLRRHAS